MQVSRPLIATIIATVLTLMTLTGCDRYRVTVNEHAVYEPSPLFADFKIDDRALFICVQQTIEDERITTAEQLKTLNCSHAGISALDGLARFAQLESLNVADNRIGDIVVLKDNPRLKQLDLRNNRLQSVETLLAMPNLTLVRLGGNTTLDCANAVALAKLVAGTELPAHCKAGG